MIQIPPLGIDLFCGLGGWTEGLLAEGYYVVGFDNTRHVYGDDRYPGQLVIQDVLTLHGRQFAGAALIVASPPCQEYSYRAMPWKRAKALPPPSNALFDACFRIQAEAIEAAGHHIPLIVENVRGAEKYVGRARWNYGSFYLWGDVPALMPMRPKRGGKNSGGIWFAQQDGKLVQRNDPRYPPAEGRKNEGGSWFGVAHNTTSGTGHNPVNNEGRKAPGQDWSRYRKTGEVSPHWRMQAIEGQKGGDRNTHRANQGPSPHFTNPAEGVKFSQSGHAWFDGKPRDKMLGDLGPAAFSSKSNARKRASALIAKIPLSLSRHIAAAWKPQPRETNPS